MKKGVKYLSLKKLSVIIIIILLFLSFKSFGKTISREEYYNKTLAMILGQFAGTLSGLEFLYDPNDPAKAWIAIPDQYYVPLGGTLGGSTLQTNHATRLPQDGLMLSDDDEHVDFFNQWVMDKHGPGAARIDWRNKWLEYDVSDFGAGYDGMLVMKNDKLLPPYTGMGEYGNPGHWLPEGYIENDSMGGAFPGMPITAMRYTNMSSTTIADFDPVLWGQFWAAAYALAYFETDARTAIDKAAQLLPPDSWPKEVYDMCIDLKNQNSDWRVSVRTIWDSYRKIYAVWEEKGHMESSDVNNGFGVLAILYAGNNYEEAMKIASLSGADAECTASAVCGLLGIILGMEGTPQYIKDRIYFNGEGIYRNDTSWFAFIRGDYPTDQKITELAATYQRNAERTIRAYGGTVSSDTYEIPDEPGMTPSYIYITNNDFEEGNLNNWNKWSSIGSTTSIWPERQVNETTGAAFAHTGYWKGTILTAAGEEAKLYVTVNGLKPGSTYRIDGWIRSAVGRGCRLYAENSDGYIFTSKMEDYGAFAHRWIYFTAGSDTSLNIGLHAPLTDTTGSTWCSIDDISIKEVFYDPGVRYEAEDAVYYDAQIVNSANASNGKYVGYINTSGTSYVEFQNIDIAFSGQKVIRIYYANNNDTATQALSIDREFVGNIKYPASGEWGVFNQNFNEAVVWMGKGTHTVRLTAENNFAEIDYIEVAAYDEYRPNVDYDIRWGGVYRITAVHSGKSLEVPDSNYNNLIQIEQNDYNGSTNQQFRLDYVSAGCYRITPIHSEKCIEIEGWSMDNGGRVVQYDYFGNVNQQWAILNMNNGLFKIVNRHSGKSLDISGGSLNNGAAAIQWDYLGTDNQLWKIEPYNQVSENINPVIAITSPAINQSFFERENITINADASDSDGSVSLVEFYIDSVKIGEDTGSPYSVIWNNASAGNHVITASVTDNEGATAAESINITVNTNNQTGITVDYNIVNDWGSGFTCEIMITNNSTAALNGWILDFTFPGSQIITNCWNASFTQTGQDVSISQLSWNSTVQPGQSVTIGFNANYSNDNQIPYNFTINGIPVN